MNGLIELHRRIARGFTNQENYRLRMLLIAGGLAHPNLTRPVARAQRRPVPSGRSRWVKAPPW